MRDITHACRGAAVACAIASAMLLVCGEVFAQTEASPPAGEELHRMRLDECIAVALEKNTDVRSSDYDQAAADANRGGARGQFAPKLHVDAYAQQWTEAYDIPFALMPGQPPLNFPVHDAFVWNATVSLIQPITGLLAIYENYKIADLGVDVAAIRKEATRRDTVYHVIEAYYRLLQATRLTEVAAASVGELETQERQAVSFHENGMVSKDDVLRAELAVENAKQRLIQSRASVVLARSRLAILMGLSPSAPVDGVPLEGEPPRRAPMSLDVAERTSLTQRVEIREVERRIDQAAADVRISYMRLLPQVSAVGSYIHNQGSLFSQLNSEYVGGTLSWDAWDWGATTSAISAAKAHARQAEIAKEKLEDEIRLEVRQAFVGVGTATEALDVAHAAVREAEENFRLVKKRYDANAATSFDVVDAEGLLTQARGQMQNAIYDYLVAGAALRRAVGGNPQPPAPSP